MSEYEATGRTVDEAVEKAITELGIRKDNAKVEVMDEPSQGILGILGNKSAKVLVKPIFEPKEFLEKYLKEMLVNMSIEGSITVEMDEEKLEAMIMGEDVGVLIGRRGKTLSDMQYIVNIVMRRQFKNLNKMTVIDVENYRARREKTLMQLARNVARKVSQDRYEQALEPMTPQERRIIHIALQDHPGIKTYSTGQEPYRKVIIAPN